MRKKFKVILTFEVQCDPEVEEPLDLIDDFFETGSTPGVQCTDSEVEEILPGEVKEVTL